MAYSSPPTAMGDVALTTTAGVEDSVQIEDYFEYFILFFSPIIVVSNVIVIVSGWLAVRAKRDPVSVYICLFNVAIADCVNCAAVLFDFVDIDGGTYKYFCAWKMGCIVSGSLTSMLSICLIAIERFLYIVHGLKYDTYLTPAKTGLFICIVWILGISFGLVPILVEVYQMDSDYVDVCEFIRSPTSVVIAAAVLAVPALIFTPIAYTTVYYHVKRIASSGLAVSSRIPAFKYKSILVVFLSSISFLVCWGPFIICCAWYKFFCEPYGLSCRNLELAVVSPLACLGFANSLLNPVIYAWWHPPYNEALKKVICPSEARAKLRASLYDKESVCETIA